MSRRQPAQTLITEVNAISTAFIRVNHKSRAALIREMEAALLQ